MSHYVASRRRHLASHALSYSTPSFKSPFNVKLGQLQQFRNRFSLIAYTNYLYQALKVLNNIFVASYRNITEIAARHSKAIRRAGKSLFVPMEILFSMQRVLWPDALRKYLMKFPFRQPDKVSSLVFSFIIATCETVCYGQRNRCWRNI